MNIYLQIILLIITYIISIIFTMNGYSDIKYGVRRDQYPFFAMLFNKQKRLNKIISIAKIICGYGFLFIFFDFLGWWIVLLLYSIHLKANQYSDRYLKTVLMEIYSRDEILERMIYVAKNIKKSSIKNGHLVFLKFIPVWLLQMLPIDLLEDVVTEVKKIFKIKKLLQPENSVDKIVFELELSDTEIQLFTKIANDYNFIFIRKNQLFTLLDEMGEEIDDV